MKTISFAKSIHFLSYTSVVLWAVLALPAISAQEQRDALTLWRNKNYPAAIQVCTEELEKRPNNLDSYAVLCWSLVGNKQYNEAELRAEQGLKISNYDLRLIEVLGEARYYLGKNNGAMEQFQKYAASANESAPRLGTVYYYMGEIYVRQGRFQHADISLTMATIKEPQLDRWWTRLGYAREMAKNYTTAIAAYEEALRLNPSSADAKKGKARAESKL